MKAVICGANGAMGKLIDGILGDAVVGRVSIDGENGVPKTFAELGKVEADVVIDFSHHSAIADVLTYAKENNLAVVVGTTGHTAEEKALIFAMDLCSLMTTYVAEIQDDLCAATGLAPERILCSCTHNHSSPDLANQEQETIPRYIAFLKKQMITAAQQALADRKPATAQIGRTHVQGLNHVRRYVLEDGTFAGDNYGHFKLSPIAGHESEPDRELQLVKLLRQGKPDVILANFQMHPHRAGGSKKSAF